MYLLDDLSVDPTVPSATATSDAATSDAQLDAWFGVASNPSTAGPSTFQSFVARMQSLRRRHSSLLILVDDLHTLFLQSHSGELDVFDGIVSLQSWLAAADAAAPNTNTTTVTHQAPSATATATSFFTVDGSAPTPASTSTSAPVALPSGLVLVAHGDLPVTPVQSLLRRHASTFIKLSALQTGYTKEISGVISVQQHQVTTDYWTPIQRSHYKIAESHVKISAPGHSSSTLQQ